MAGGHIGRSPWGTITRAPSGRTTCSIAGAGITRGSWATGGSPTPRFRIRREHWFSRRRRPSALRALGRLLVLSTADGDADYAADMPRQVLTPRRLGAAGPEVF